MTDMKDWPLVPVDPACVPEGYEAVRVGRPKQGEETTKHRSAYHFDWEQAGPCEGIPRLIIRPIPKPIKLPTTIVPSGWWVAKDGYDRISIYELKPILPLQDDTWIRNGGWCLDLAPPIAAQLPSEYLALPWDQSLMQQTEGM